MRIGIFSNFNHFAGGAFQYSSTLLTALSKIEGPYQFVLFSPSGNSLPSHFSPSFERQTIDAALMAKLLQFTGKIGGADGLDLMERGSNVDANNYFREHGIDLMLYPTSEPLSFLANVPFIMAIHDLQHRLNPQFPEVSALNNWYDREFLFRNVVRYSHGILTDSEVGKEDVLACYKGLISKEHIYPLPFAPAYSDEIDLNGDLVRSVRSKYQLPERYLFYPAQFWSHKNHARLVHAVHILRVRHKIDAHLVLVGSNTGSDSRIEAREFVFNNVMTLAKRLEVQELIHYLGYVPDQYMPVLYQMAVGLAMPTFFGPTNIPVLEAWQFGCPVVTSDIRGIREQAGDAAVLVDPNEAESIASGLLKIWSDKKLSDDFIQRGYRRIKTFSIENFTSNLQQILKDAVSRLSFNNPEGSVSRESNVQQLATPNAAASTERIEIFSEQCEPLVSAIVSTYNAERFIRGCLDDLVNQSLFVKGALEIVVIDSGSQQNERAVVEEFQRKYPNITYQRTQRETLYGAWNSAIKVARGKYLTPANTDDRHRPDALEVMAKTLEELPVGMVYSDVLLTSVENETYHQNSAKLVWELPDYSLRQALVHCPFGSKDMWRRSVHDEIGLFDPKYTTAGDYEFFLRLVSRYSAFHIRETLGLYYESQKNLSYRDQNKVIEEVYSFLPAQRESTQLEDLYLFLKEDKSDEARLSALLDWAYHLGWSSVFPDYSKVQRLYEKVMELVGGPVDSVMNNLGIALFRQGKKSEAVETLNRAARSSKVAAENLSRILDEQKVPKLDVYYHQDSRLRALPGIVTPQGVRLPIAAYREKQHESRIESSAGSRTDLTKAFDPENQIVPEAKSAKDEIASMVVWFAPIFNPSGYADEARNFILNLDRQNVSMAARSISDISEQFRAELAPEIRTKLDSLLQREVTQPFISIIHGPGYALSNLTESAYSIGRTMFETEGLPPGWAQKCNQMDEIWVPAHTDVENFRKSGVTVPIVIIPEGIDAMRFKPGLKPLSIPGTRGKVFLSVFEWIYRKGWDVLLRSWAKAFAASDNVSLVLRTYPIKTADGSNAHRKIDEQIDQFLDRELRVSRHQVAPIIVLGDLIPDKDMPRLYAAADVYLAPSRGEGWGRPHIEAMASGLPVIATGWGGNLEFMTSDNSLLIDYEMAPVDDRCEINFYRGLRWAEPSADHLSHLLRQAVNEPERMAAIGERARNDIVERWTWDKAAAIATGRIREIEKALREGRKPSPPTLRTEMKDSLNDNSDDSAAPKWHQHLPADVSLILEKADREYKNRNLSSARDVLKEALGLAPGDISILTTLGSVSFELEDYPAAQSYFLRASQMDRSNVSILIQIAMTNLKLGSVPEFEAALAYALEIAPTNFDALKMLADLNFQEGRYKDAAQTYSKILQHHKDDLDALLALGVCFFKTGDLDMAKEIFERVLSLVPNNLLARENLSVIRQKLGEPFSSSLSLTESPSIRTPHESISALLAKADTERKSSHLTSAKELLLQAEKIATDDLRVLSSLADLFLGLREFSSARERLVRLCRLTPNDPTILVQLALANLKLEEIDQFEAHLGRALELDPYHREGLKLLGDLNFENGRWKDAARAFTKIIGKNPKDAEALLALGDCFLKENDLETAETVFKRLLEFEPGNRAAQEKIDSILEKRCESGKTLDIPGPAVSNVVIPFPTEAASKTEPELGTSKDQPFLSTSQSAIPKLVPKGLNPKVNELVDEATFFNDVGNLEGAIETLERAAELAPRDPGIMDALGSLYFSKEDYEEARQKFRRLIEIRPREVSAYTRLAMTCLKLGRIQEMESSLGIALEIQPDNRDALKFLAKTNFENNRLQDAGRVYTRLIEKDPRDIESLLSLALCFYKAEDFDAARMVYERVLEAEPRNATAQSNLVLLDQQSKKAADPKPKQMVSPHQGQIAQLKQALAAAESAFAKGDLVQARASLEDVLRHDPNAPDILGALGSLCFQLGDLKWAKSCFEQLVKAVPGDASKWVQFAVVLHHLDEVDEFEKALGRALTLDPNHLEALRLLGHLNFTHGSLVDAAQTYGKILRRTPDDIEALTALGVCFYKTQDLEAAKMMFDRVLELEPDNSVARDNLNIVHQKLGQSPSGLPNDTLNKGSVLPNIPSNEAANPQPPSLNTLLTEADAKVGAGNLSGAASVLECALSFYPDNPDILAVLGSISFQLGNTSRSYELLNKAVQIEPASADYYTRLALAALMLERISEFEAALGKALEIDRRYCPALKLLADLNFRNNRLKDAAVTYNELLRQNQEDVEVLLPLGVCFYKTGDMKAALMLFEQALKIDPNNDIALANRDLAKRKLASEESNPNNSASAITEPAKFEKTSEEPKCDRLISIIWEGSQFVHHSLALINREISIHLLSRGHEISILPYEPDQFGPEQDPRFERLALRVRTPLSKPAEVHVRHQWPLNSVPPKDGHWVIIQPWEFGSIPKDWVSILKRVDELWVPSHFVRNCYISSGVPGNKVYVIPNGIDPEKFHPVAQPISIPTKKRFKFLFVGGTIHRKGADILLNAYLASFRASDDVCLVIKDFGSASFYRGQTLGDKIREIQKQPESPEIVHLQEDLPPSSLPGLYTACHCLVHPFRGEGFGLPILEAMACGLPVIITAGGSADDFAPDDFAYRIPAVRKNIGRAVGDIELIGEGWLLELDLAALKERLISVVRNPEVARALGRKASDHVREHWTWRSAAAKAEERMKTLIARGGQPVRFQPEAQAELVEDRKPAPLIEVPPVGRLAALTKVHGLLSRKRFLKAWNAALEAIVIRPFHPDAYLQMIEIAFAAEDDRQAFTCAERLIQMTPNWPLAQKVYESLKQQKTHRQSKIKWTPLPAIPARPRISVCLIAKNEEEFIGRCLASVKPFASQIVVVDTGSTDRTVEIAKQHGAEVHTFQWNDNFSDARNAAHQYARGDWVLILDADEELTADNYENLWKDVSAQNVLGYRIPICNVHESADSVTYVPRLFRNAPALFFVGRVHEQIYASVVARTSEWGMEATMGTAMITHYGYDPGLVKRRQKVRRNLKLMELAVQEMPNEAALLMNYGLDLVNDSRLEEGLEKYRQAVRVLEPHSASAVLPEVRERLVTLFGVHLMKAGRFEETIDLMKSRLASDSGPTASIEFMAALSLIKLNRPAEALPHIASCIERLDLPTLTPACHELRKGAPYQLMAETLVKTGKSNQAEDYFKKALALDPHSASATHDYAYFLHQQNRAFEALQMLQQGIANGINDERIWHLGSFVSNSKPDFIEFAVDWTTEALKFWPENAAIQGLHAESLLKSGQFEKAMPFYERLSRSSNVAAQAALILCQMCLERKLFPVPVDQEAKVSIEFIGWYKRLVMAQTKASLAKINANLAALRTVLPSAATTLEKALAEAKAME